MEWILLQRLELAKVQRILDPATFYKKWGKPMEPEKKHNDVDDDDGDADDEDDDDVKAKEEMLAAIKSCRQDIQIMKDTNQLLEGMVKINEEGQRVLNHQHKLFQMKLHVVKHKRGTKKVLDPIWRKILADNSPAFQPLRQMLMEHEPDSQNEWLRHARAFLKSHNHTT